MLGERLLLAIVLAGAAYPILRKRHGHRVPLWLVAGVVLVSGSVVALSFVVQPGARRDNGEHRFPARVEQVAEDGYVSSAKCRKCHPSEYHSWRHSFHRTMTQRATPATVLGDFEDVDLELRGCSYHLERRGDEFWVRWSVPPVDEISRARSAILTLRAMLESGDPTIPADALSRVARELASREAEFVRLRRSVVTFESPILQTTGSHHQQVYWHEWNLPGELHTLPFLWLISERRWVPRESVFIAPPSPAGPDFGPWNSNCIKCHATHGKPRPIIDNPETAHIESQVAELGIACEACHGPGEEHVRANENPLRRYGQHASDSGDETVVQPERLSVRASAQVCGYCHSVSYFNDKQAYWKNGSSFRPGADLAGTKGVSSPRSSVGHSERHLGPLRNSFWPDGVVRLLGREYNGLQDSPCHQRGEMTCLSCHTMHGDDPDDQLRPGMRGDLACLQCHEDFGGEVAIREHTHHDPGGSGARCLNCHMTYSVYGLLKATRSHTVESPNAAVSKRAGRPNACNQCHVDRTLAWAADRLTEWYGQPPVEDLDEDETRYSATILWLLRGDAAQRALAAWTLGWEDAHAVAGTDWQAPFLARLLDDPYDAVRYVVGQSLGRLPGYESFEYDFVSDPASRVAARQAAILAWDEHGQGAVGGSRARLTDEQGRILNAEIERLQAQRDDTPITISE